MPIVRARDVINDKYGEVFSNLGEHEDLDNVFVVDYQENLEMKGSFSSLNHDYFQITLLTC